MGSTARVPFRPLKYATIRPKYIPVRAEYARLTPLPLGVGLVSLQRLVVLSVMAYWSG